MQVFSLPVQPSPQKKRVLYYSIPAQQPIMIPDSSFQATPKFSLHDLGFQTIHTVLVEENHQ